MKFGQQVRLNLYILYEFRLGRQLFGRDYLGKLYLHNAARGRVEADFLRAAIKVARRVDRLQIDVRIEYRLHEIVAGRQTLEASSERSPRGYRSLRRDPAQSPRYRARTRAGRRHRIAEGQPRFGPAAGVEHDKEPPILGDGDQACGNRYFKPQRVRLLSSGDGGTRKDYRKISDKILFICFWLSVV